MADTNDPSGPEDRFPHPLLTDPRDWITLSEALPQVIWATGPEGGNVFFNRRWEEYTGQTPGQSLGTGWHEPFHPEDRPRAREAWLAAGAARTGYTVECRIRNREGVYRWWRVRGDPVFGPEGRITKWFGTYTDIDDQRSAERRLDLHTRLMDDLLDHSQALIYVVDPEGRFLAVNRALEDLFGVPRHTLRGRTREEVMPAPVAAEHRRNDLEVIRRGQAASFEETNQEPDGDHDYLTTKFPLLDGEGRIYGIAGISTDITERKRSQADASAAQAILGTALASMNDAVFICDPTGRFTHINQAFAAFHRFPSLEACPRTFDSYPSLLEVRRGDGTEVPFDQWPIPRALAGETAANVEYHLRRRDTDEAWTGSFSYAPIRGPEGRIGGCVVTGRDVTQTRRLEEALQKTAKLESLGLLAGGIAHDFNNLLGGLFALVELAERTPSAEKRTGYLVQAHHTLDRARGLTNQLLTFATGGAPVKTVQDLFPFVQDTVLFALSGTAVSARFAVASDLWSCEFDRNQIGQVVDNLAINAHQAMPRGGVLRIEATNLVVGEGEHPGLKPGPHVRIAVRDEGTGISPEVLPRIFDPFFTTKPQGHGLGLATCFSILLRHGGTIEARSEPGKGSEFAIYLPASSPAVPVPPPPVQGEFRGQGTLVVMEDLAILREALGEMLELLGYRVLLAEDGRGALELYDREVGQGRPVVGLLLDLTVPGGPGGLDLARQFRSRDPAVRLYATSGFAESPVLSRPGDYGFQGGLKKPFTLDDLVQMLRTS